MGNFLFEDKFNFLDVAMEIAHHSVLSDGLPCIAFVDHDFWSKIGTVINIPNVEFVLCNEGTDPDSVKWPDGNACLGIYAIQHASVGMPFVTSMIRKGIKYKVAGGYKVGGYVYDDLVARRSIENSYLSQRLALFDKFGDPGSVQDFVNLCQALYNTRNLPGDVVEIGCYRGSSGSMMLDYAKAKGLPAKTFHFLDVFTGFDYEEALTSSDAAWANTHGTEGREVVEERLQERAGINTVHVYKANVISDPLPQIESVTLCNIDVDLYEAVRAALFRFAPLITLGGIMICEDAGHTPSLIGARVALEEFLDAHAGKQFTPVHMPSGQVFLIRHS